MESGTWVCISGCKGGGAVYVLAAIFLIGCGLLVSGVYDMWKIHKLRKSYENLPESENRNLPDGLKPGDCECGHFRCCHREGRGRCDARIDMGDDGKPLPKEEYCACACSIYIRDDDDDNENGDCDPAPKVDEDELERIGKL